MTVSWVVAIAMVCSVVVLLIYLTFILVISHRGSPYDLARVEHVARILRQYLMPSWWRRR